MEFSLDEIIQQDKLNKRKTRTLAEVIELKKQKSQRSTAPVKNGACPPSADTFKSLKDIIKERGIPKPPSYCTNGLCQSSNVCAAFEKEVMETGAASTNPLFGLPTSPSCDMTEDEVALCNDVVVQHRKHVMNVSNKRNADEMDTNANTSRRKTIKFELKPLEFVMTPYRAVGYLSEKGMLIELKIGRLSIANNDKSADRSHLWRCEVSCGSVIGICDSVRKAVARELACDEFLRSLSSGWDAGKIASYVVPEELFIDPVVFRLVEKAGVERALDVCHEIKMNVERLEEGSRRDPVYTYTCTYYVGVETYADTSRYLEHAKLNAARKAYESTSGKTFMLTEYFVGNQCNSSLEYEFNESEVYQTIIKGE